MTDREKLQEIRSLCLFHIGDRNSLESEIMKVINTKKKPKTNEK